MVDEACCREVGALSLAMHCVRDRDRRGQGSLFLGPSSCLSVLTVDPREDNDTLVGSKSLSATQVSSCYDAK